MVGSTRDRVAVAHRSEHARAWAGRGGVRTMARADQGDDPGVGQGHGDGGARPVSSEGSRPGWSDRGVPTGGRGKLGLAALVVVVVLAAILGLTQRWGRVPGPETATAQSVQVVWHQSGQEAAKVTVVDRAAWQDFVASRQVEHVKSRQAVLDQTRAEMVAAVRPLFDDMKGRIKDYTGWFYFFPTTYRMAFTAGIAALSRDATDQHSAGEAATLAINQLLHDRFIEVVVVPERFGPAVEEKARAALHHAIASELADAEAENRTLEAFLAEHGRVATDANAGAGADQAMPVVLSWEALGHPAAASSMAAPPDANQLLKNDPAFGDLQSSVGAEGTMLVARQIARRVVQVAVNNVTTATVMPMVAGGVLGPAEVVVSPLLGIAAFGLGIGAELGTVKLRQAVEGPMLTEVSESVVDHLKESQSRILADAVVKRVDSWLGG